MDPLVSSSFIPKKPLTQERGSRGGVFGLVFLLAILFFIGSLLAAGGAFAYGRILQGSLASKSEQLTVAQGAYNPGVIEDLIRLDTRITQARSVLSEHTAPSSFFFFLSEQTLEKVRFTSLDFQYKEDGSATVQLRGETDTFSTIALQSDQFGASKALKEIIFSDIVVGEGKGVTFTVNAVVDPSLLSYSRAVQNPSSSSGFQESETAPEQAAESAPQL